MGGSSSSSYSISSRGYGDTGSDCDRLRRNCDLQDIDYKFLPTLEEGNILDVSLTDNGKKVVATYGRGDIVGVVVIPEANKLIECIKLGILFKAAILKIRGVTCTVEVSKR